MTRERRKILRYVYAGIDARRDIEGIEAEALEIGEKDPGQAERFYGNRAGRRHGVWCAREAVDRSRKRSARWWPGDADRRRLRRLAIPTTGRASAARPATATSSRRRSLTAARWSGTRADYGGQVPRLEVSAGLAHIVATYKLARLYADPPYWESECDAWAELYGEDVVIRWYTKRATQMHTAAERLLTDLGKADSGFWHDGCETTEQHVARDAQVSAAVCRPAGPLHPPQARRRSQDRHGDPLHPRPRGSRRRHRGRLAGRHAENYVYFI